MRCEGGREWVREEGGREDKVGGKEDREEEEPPFCHGIQHS